MTSAAGCAHHTCRCTRPYSPQTQAAATSRIDPHGAYCSRRCEEVEERGEPGEGTCECGHPQCQRPADTGIPPMQ